MHCLSFLISTRGDHPNQLKALLNDIENQTYLDINIVVVLQPDSNTNTDYVLHIIDSMTTPADLVISETIGLSKSRNIAISKATGDYLLLCDDDCRYPENAAAEIVVAMAKYTDWDIITFQMADFVTGDLYRQYPLKPTKHTLRSLTRVGSIEVVLRKCVSKGITLFDERIGLGTPYITGAENVMLVDAYKRGIVAGYFPQIIVAHPEDSSGRGSGFNPSKLDQLVLSKAVAFRRMFGLWGVLLVLVFFVRRLFPGKVLRFKFKQFYPLIRGLFVRL